MGKLGSLLDRISRPKGDRLIWIAVLILLSISMVEVFSASSRQTFGKSSFLNPIIVHMAHIVFGLVIMYACHMFKRFNYRLLSALLVLCSIAGLAMLSVRGFHSSKAQRWIELGFFQLQPSEFAKLAVVMTVSQMLAKLEKDNRESQKRIFWRVLAFTGIICALIVGENLSTALLICFVVMILMMFGGITWKRMTILVSSALGIAVLVVFFFKTVPPETIKDMADSHRFFPSRAETWQARVLDFFDGDEQYSAADYARFVAPDKTQETHANIAIATSGIIGKMPGNSNERDYLQEANSDFIFAIIIEELGMLGALGIMVIYFVLLLRIGRIVVKCRRAGQSENAYLTAGIGLLLITQAFLNMSVAVGLGPVTGQPLPLISKGGSSMLMSSIGMGIILGIGAALDETEMTDKLPQQDDETETIDC